MNVPTDEALSRVAFFAKQQRELEQQVKDADTALKLAQDRLARVAEVDLPDALAACGLAEVKLEDGARVTVAPEYYANISAERRASAFAWLRDQGHGDLIKNQITVSLGRGEDETAHKVKQQLDAVGVTYAELENVHPQTLKAFVREQIETGAGLPQETFGVHIKRVAKVRVGKGKR